jgi:hypothetical protein
MSLARSRQPRAAQRLQYEIDYAYAMQREQYRPPLSVAPSAPDGSTMRFRRALRWSSAEPFVPWFIDAVEQAEWYPDYCTHEGFTHGFAADPSEPSGRRCESRLIVQR